MPLGRRARAAGTLGMRAAPAVGFAQAFPSRQLRLVVPFPPDGASDTVGGQRAASMSETLAPLVVVGNWPGASTVIGAEAVARAASDGHAMLLATSTMLAKTRIPRRRRASARTEAVPAALAIVRVVASRMDDRPAL